MFERPQSANRAILVHIDFSDEQIHEELDEFQELAKSAGAEVVGSVCGARRKPDAKYFVGTGKSEEIRVIVQQCNADLVIVNHALSPSQERNLERRVGARFLSRTGLILDIFAQRAFSHEGKLQVELAQLTHLSTRLVRGWSHLERQKGGIGLRGPGETQLETDRRLLGNRIKLIQKRLRKVSAQRQQSRKTRLRAGLSTVSLVGYTNAGKSTLFNRLTGARVHCEDKLFATLDPTLRRFSLGKQQRAILADTVGFIRHLPHDLVAAFRSTLEETRSAKLILHVSDAGHPDRLGQSQQVNSVLAEIEASDVPQIEVFNKIDTLTGQTARLEHDENGRVKRVWLSAHTGEGLELLRESIAQYFAAGAICQRFNVPATAARMRAKLFEQGAVIAECKQDDGWIMDLQLAPWLLASLGQDAQILISQIN